MGLRDTVEFAHVTLGLVPEILDPVDVVPLVGEQLRVIDPKVFEVGDVERVVALPAVGIDDAIGDDLALNNRQQSSAGSIGNDLRVNLPATLEKPENRDFPRRTTTSLALSLAAEIAFVHLDLATEHRLAFGLKLIGDDLAQPMIIERRCLAVHATKTSCRTSRRPGDKMLDQTILLVVTQTALAHGPHDNPQTGLSGTAPFFIHGE